MFQVRESLFMSITQRLRLISGLSLSLLLTLLANTQVLAKESALSLDYYLPETGPDASYNSTISRPETHLGHQVGEWHARHDLIVSYMYRLAEQSDRVSVIEMGRTNEQRPQILVVITSPENQANLEAIIKVREQEPLEQKSQTPLVVWLGYSVHGNEASGTNTSLLTAYHLTALQSAEHDEFLKNSIVLIEPSLNPDGYGRFSTWANNNKSQHMNGDPMDREHREDWPNGRTNHYRFDLNRDWLLLTHKESRARLNYFHKFKPHVLGDFHEMGSNSTYFFQPGVPARQNPLTPEKNFELTDKIARYHAEALDNIGSLYYSKQGFDDYYYGKGSTYPDVNGAVGILFEQASARGHLQQTVNGELSFPFAIRNQFTTSLSTLKGAYENRQALQDYQVDFYSQAANQARNDSRRAVLFSDDGDEARALALVDILKRHRIKVYRLAQSVQSDDLTIDSGYIVPYNQSQYLLIKAIFETRTRFRDNTFYDVSTWTLPHAFNLPYINVDRRIWRTSLLGEEIKSVELPAVAEAPKAKVAYAIDWNHYRAPAALNALLSDGIKVRMASRAFNAKSHKGNSDFAPGTLIIPVGIQSISGDDLHKRVNQIARNERIELTAIQSGYANQGVDLGSGSMEPLTLPKPLLLTGPGTSAYETGEVWHLLDQHLELPLTQVRIADLNRIDLDNYTHLVLVDGGYGSINENTVEKIKTWVSAGGVLVATKSGSAWAAEQKLIDIEFMESPKTENVEQRDYSELDKDDAQKVIGGSIFATDVDISHPLAFGYQRSFMPSFRNHTRIMKPSQNPYGTVVRYTKEPLLSGFVSDENLERIAGSAMMVAERKGQGSVVLILDNPVFRGYWYGSSRLFINSLYFGKAFDRPSR